MQKIKCIPVYTCIYNNNIIYLYVCARVFAGSFVQMKCCHCDGSVGKRYYYFLNDPYMIFVYISSALCLSLFT